MTRGENPYSANIYYSLNCWCMVQCTAFSLQKIWFQNNFSGCTEDKTVVLSCFVMDSGICLRNPPLPFSSIPTCAVICNIWQYQSEMGVTENCGQSWDTLEELLTGEVPSSTINAVSVNSIWSPYYSWERKRTKSGSSKLCTLIVWLNFLLPWKNVLCSFQYHF